MKFELYPQRTAALASERLDHRIRAQRYINGLVYGEDDDEASVPLRGRDVRHAPHLKPPSGHYKDWSQVSDDLNKLNSQIEEDYQRVIDPASEIEPAAHAWKMELRSRKSDLDPLTQALFSESDLYLCRFVFKVLEGADEQVKRIEYSVEHKAATVYRMWPSKEYRIGSEVRATVEAKLGVGKSLDFIPVSAEASAGLVWSAEWRSVSVITAASGQGTTVAEWRMTRNKREPWAGDVICLAIVQLPVGKRLRGATASCSAVIRPKGWLKDERYVVPTPIQISYRA